MGGVVTVTRQRAGGPVVTEVVGTGAAERRRLVARVAELEGELARCAPVVAEQRQRILGERLAAVSERLTVSEAARQQAEQELTELRAVHAELVAGHQAAASRQAHADALTAEKLVKVAWVRDSQPSSCDINGRGYTGWGPRVRHQRHPDREDIVTADAHGLVAEMPVSDALVLRQAGFVVGHTEADEEAIVAAGRRPGGRINPSHPTDKHYDWTGEAAPRWPAGPQRAEAH